MSSTDALMAAFIAEERGHSLSLHTLNWNTDDGLTGANRGVLTGCKFILSHMKMHHSKDSFNR